MLNQFNSNSFNMLTICLFSALFAGIGSNFLCLCLCTLQNTICVTDFPSMFLQPHQGTTSVTKLSSWVRNFEWKKLTHIARDWNYCEIEKRRQGRWERTHKCESIAHTIVTIQCNKNNNTDAAQNMFSRKKSAIYGATHRMGLFVTVLYRCWAWMHSVKRNIDRCQCFLVAIQHVCILYSGISSNNNSYRYIGIETKCWIKRVPIEHFKSTKHQKRKQNEKI